MSNTTAYLAWQGLFPYKRFGSPFFWIGTLGVGLGVMLLIIVVSVMAGFDATYRDKIVQLQGDLRVERGGFINQSDRVVADIQKNPEVAAAAPYGEGFMMIEHKHRPAFPMVRGVDPAQESKVVPYAKMMQTGAFEKLDDEGVLLGSSLAKQIGATVGSSVDIYTPLMISRLGKNELLLPRALKVVGIYQTDWHDIDQNTMLISLNTFQELYGLADNVHGITVRLKDSQTLEATSAAITSTLGAPYSVVSWKERFKDFLWVLDLEKNLMFFLMMFVIVVAAFAMGAAQLMTVLRKTREIGLIMAMGSTTWAVSSVYALQGAIVGVVGVIGGNITALIILAFRNNLLGAIAEWTGTHDTYVKFYQFANLPMSYSLADAGAIALAAIVLATISGMVPAMFVSKLKPAEALRND